ncbi:MAG TPA: alpha/beta hydrolase [Phenylobacterium sp.]|uniref:alpha/beta hydrolase n=1 Tax=Phenylobacterium sp. TaxID=1871053 RepID=UPI002B4A2EF2|nr:alpha/beta hydrolase [Phenylobacterium sp.]HKR89316.1 alpha/beta hydrolase [Phenylobacterium sp.]
MLQIDSNLAQIRQKIADMGARFDPGVLAATMALYADAVATSAPGVERIADIAFGEHPRQQLDIYRPRQQDAPVLVFFPGGGFISGGKDEHPSFYRNVGVYFARHGYLAIIANYRLAPEFCWAEQTADVAAAVAWVSANAVRYGGDPGGLSLMGQSAGAVNLANYLFHPLHGGAAEAAGVRRAILMSGVYRFTPQLPPNVQHYAGPPSLWRDRSPLTHARRNRIPLSLCLAQYDPAMLAAPTLELALALTRRDGCCPPLHRFAGHNHVSTVQSLGSADDQVGAVLRAMLEAP